MQPWKPTAKWSTNFRKALDDAFNAGSISLLLADYFNLTFGKISPPAPGKEFENHLQEVIEKARMEDWLVDLVAASHERRPANAALTAIADGLGLTMTGPRLINETGRSLEEIVRSNAKFIDVDAFSKQLPLLEGRVCFIDIPGGGGTGFLVGPDLVLTNDHVVERIRNGGARPQDVTCRFDYRQAVDGSVPTRKLPVEVKLARDWLVDSKPPSSVDWDPALGEADEVESDFAILRLESAIGDEPVGGDTMDADARPRGWIDTTGDVPAMARGNQVFLLQHPEGEPLQLTIGTVVEFNKAGTRVRYDANSKNGSSGSPVFDADLRLVALHHARDPADPPKWNQAIPMAVIKSVWDLPAR